jgi:hypothetical protein
MVENKHAEVVDQAKVSMLIDFGFPKEESQLALKITNNDTEAAVELLVAGGSTLESLQALAAKSSANQNMQQPPKHELECKMTIVVRDDKDS